MRFCWVIILNINLYHTTICNIHIFWITVVNKQTSWSSANSTCELAGFRLSGPVSPEQIPVDSALPEQSFWIGALSHHTPWFQVYSKLMFI